ncbi:NUDIX domain-containing protein [Dactylosporangium sp. CA-092794]|uniref:NUDIX domain-containing protein n=1 Tax=Dactylosporangium sp. CA-092794 TaxID=3239929 RepID=UPI003D8DE36F
MASAAAASAAAAALVTAAPAAAGGRHCPRCGGRTGPLPAVCGACGYQAFLNPRPTGSAIILDGDRFLAILRARPPRAGWWDLPGGFCDGFEHPADAAVREAREELGVEIELGEFAGMYIGTYEFQDEPLPILDCFWVARITAGEITLDPSEGTEYTWLPLTDPPEMAFPTMDVALRNPLVRASSSRLAS